MLRWVSVAPFGNPVVPDVYWMLIGSSGPQASSAARRGRRRSRAPAPATSSSQSSSQKKIARSRPGSSGRDLLDHVDVVRRLERRGGEQHPAPRLVEGVRQLVGAVGRVDVDEDRRRSRRWRTAAASTRRSSGSTARPGRRPRGPSPISPVAQRSTRSAKSSYVQRTPWWRATSASRLPWAATVRARLAPIVSSSSGMSVGPASRGECHRRPFCPSDLAPSAASEGQMRSERRRQVAGAGVDAERAPGRHRGVGRR